PMASRAVDDSWADGIEARGQRFDREQTFATRGEDVAHERLDGLVERESQYAGALDDPFVQGARQTVGRRVRVEQRRRDGAGVIASDPRLEGDVEIAPRHGIGGGVV